jgi:hypothetical protein
VGARDDGRDRLARALQGLAKGPVRRERPEGNCSTLMKVRAMRQFTLTIHEIVFDTIMTMSAALAE